MITTLISIVLTAAVSNSAPQISNLWWNAAAYPVPPMAGPAPFVGPVTPPTSGVTTASKGIMPVPIAFETVSRPSFQISAAVISSGPTGTNYLLSWTPSVDPAAYEQNLYSGLSSGNYTNAIGIPNNTTSSMMVSNVVGRCFWAVSCLDAIGDEEFSLELYWPPFTNIYTFTSTGTNLYTSSSILGPWSDTGVTTLSITNPADPAHFFKGHNATWNYIRQ